VTDNDAELNAAIVAFFRAWCLRDGEKSPESFFAQTAREDGFEQFVDRLLSENDRRGITGAFRIFHAQHGRYPTFEELMSRGWWASTERPAGAVEGI
jgi:hypothetical protein